MTSTGATSGEGIAHSLSVDASQTQITAVGTIATGVWNGTAIANANLANSTISGISLGSNLNALTVDDSSIQLNSGTTYTGASARTISIKASGVTNAMLAGSIANAKLANSSITINGSSVSLGGTRTLVTDDIAEDGSPTNLYHTTERVQDVVGGQIVTNGSHAGISFAYDDSGDGAIDATVNATLGTHTTGNYVATLTGTANEVEVSASIGAITVGLPDDVTIAGNLTVNGTTTTVNSTTVTVDDKNIELGSVASPSDTTADGGGITLKGASDKTILWNNSTDNWTFNQAICTTGALTSSGILKGTQLCLTDNAIYYGDNNSLHIYSTTSTSSYMGFHGCDNRKGWVGFSVGCTFNIYGCDGSTNLFNVTCASVATATTFCGSTLVKSPTVCGTSCVETPVIKTSGAVNRIDFYSGATNNAWIKYLDTGGALGWVGFQGVDESFAIYEKLGSNKLFCVTPASLATSAIFCGTTCVKTPTVCSFNIGCDNTNTGTDAVVFGISSQATAGDATAVGRQAIACNSKASAFGFGSQARCAESLAVGFYAYGMGCRAIGIGYYSCADANYSVAVGYQTKTHAVNGSAYGRNSETCGPEATAVGNYTCATADDSSAFGYYAKATGACSTAVGNASLAPGSGSSAFGFGSCANCTGTTAVGYYSKTCNDSYAAAFGNQSIAYAKHATAIGQYAKACIELTTNLAGPMIHKKDDGETYCGDFLQFSSAETTLMTKEIDLKTTACHTITIPTGATFFINEAGVISTCVDTLTTQATFKIGCATDATNTILENTQTTDLTAAKKRERYIPNNSEDGLQTITVEISTGASATTAKGRFYFKGMLVEDE